MKKILIIGGGAMGSAFTIPCLENKNDVTITEPYTKRFIRDLSSKRKYHSALKIKLPRKLKFRKLTIILKRVAPHEALSEEELDEQIKGREH